MAGCDSPHKLLKEEFIQRADEGCVIPDELRARYHAVDPDHDAWNEPLLDPIYEALMALPDDPDLAAREPNDLDAIRALRPEGPRRLPGIPKGDDLLDRLHGALTGRCTGCALGKPPELRGMRRDASGELIGRRIIRQYLEKRGDWPLRDFFSSREIGDGDPIPISHSYRENIAYMEPDDDIHYTLVGLGVLEQHGGGFDWQNVGRYWLTHIPVGMIFTAEINAVTNLMWRSAAGKSGNATPEWCRRHRNPYREWIGAQIRADGWAYACPGHPERAAEFAWRDAHWTHERNGIYGEMFFAAVIAASFVESDFQRLVEIGLSEIPAECRLAQWIRQALDWFAECPDWERAVERMETALPGMHPVHTINNALVCLIALYYGGGRLDDTICIAVMCALDTDCNAATTGSIIGAIRGQRELKSRLAPRLNDTIKPNIIGFQQIRMEAVARRFLTLAGKV